ncbi:hypothetical protein GGS23DRAFT_407615 [Durotheca rogersii]|uniref:uncharacterized protein n=1 Tax=Durotheca rogersii TaxID=419775 RepID=UPI00221F1FD8|nr:uncharacterized protein GGS23DRAFT_407615 [Durotheca rogersii]KAI5865079.1 hypothetical protein GGS23DRAFT_407615 [Durotheca rogersii]
MKGLCSPLVLLLAISGYTGNSLADTNTFSRRALDIPSSQNFIRHRSPSVVILGDYVYIDGGEYFQQNNGTGANATQYSSYAVNATFSLTLKESWANETVEFQSIPKTAPLLSDQVYWSNPSIRTFYTWGGKVVEPDQSPPTNELWRFNADISGGGAWSQATQLDYRYFSKLRRPIGAAVTQSADVGYALGGQVTSETDGAVQKEYPGYALTGLVSYNFRTGMWSNQSSFEFGGYGTSLNSRAEYVPFGPNGLLLFLGGAETPVNATEESIVQLSWNKLTLHDPVTGKWYTQATKGTRPPTVERACTVGVRGPNNTYEIFIYGGASDQTGNTSADVHVLSLPGFVFFKGPNPGTPRADHACAVIGHGKRQMLSVGGIDGGPRLRSAVTTPDPWKRGLGIFDMSDMRWVNSYDPNAAAYQSPAVVSDWYALGGMTTMVWDDIEMKELFVNSSSSTYGGADVSLPMPPDRSTDTSGIGTSNTSTIVGSAVGGAVALAAIGAILFSVLRKRRRRESPVPSDVVAAINEYRPEPWPKDWPRFGSVTPGTTLGPTPEPAEMSGIGRGELPGPDLEWAYELPAPTPRLRPELPDKEYTI